MDNNNLLQQLKVALGEKTDPNRLAALRKRIRILEDIKETQLKSADLTAIAFCDAALAQEREALYKEYGIKDSN